MVTSSPATGWNRTISSLLSATLRPFPSPCRWSPVGAVRISVCSVGSHHLDVVQLAGHHVQALD
jgi:hypothetical protein